jgi:hypothetical protein
MENISAKQATCLTLGSGGRLFGGGVHGAANEMPIYVDQPTYEAYAFEAEKRHRALIGKLRDLRAYIRSVS